MMSLLLRDGLVLGMTLLGLQPWRCTHGDGDGVFDAASMNNNLEA